MLYGFLDWMRGRGIWLGETEDKLRIAPRADRDRRTARAAQHLARGINRYLIGVCAYEECPLFDTFLPVIGLRARQRAYSDVYHSPITVAGLYWHFVDMVWIFLFALIYLPGRSG